MKDLNTNYQIFCLTTTPYLQNELSFMVQMKSIHRKQLENFFRTIKKKKRGKNLISDTFLLSHSKSSESRVRKTCKTDFSGLSKASLSLSLYFLFSNRNRVVRLSPRASVSVNTDSIKMVFPAQL